jgi:hypothetical protein
LHDRLESLFAVFAKTILRKSMIPNSGKSFPKGPCSNVQRPAAIRPLDVTGMMPVISERMDAIRNIKTMAGSPDADLIRSASRNLAHGFCVFEARPCLS